MKLLAVALFVVLSFTSAYAQNWPHNLKTGKVEFTGLLPWPVAAKTDAQRKALAWRWYLSRLTDESAEAVRADARSVVSPSLLTYAGLPVAVVVGNASPPNPGILSYTVLLVPQKDGLHYSLSELRFSRTTDMDEGLEIEQVLNNNLASDRPALSSLYNRLLAATHWR